VMSATHSSFGPAAVKLRRTRSLAASRNSLGLQIGLCRACREAGRLRHAETFRTRAIYRQGIRLSVRS
jgi:hypothetical protein